MLFAVTIEIVNPNRITETRCEAYIVDQKDLPSAESWVLGYVRGIYTDNCQLRVKYSRQADVLRSDPLLVAAWFD